MAKKRVSVYYVRDNEGSYFRGNTADGKPVCDGCRDEAMEMTREDIDTDFPDGLPDGWTMEKK